MHGEGQGEKVSECWRGAGRAYQNTERHPDNRACGSKKEADHLKGNHCLIQFEEALRASSDSWRCRHSTRCYLACNEAERASVCA